MLIQIGHISGRNILRYLFNILPDNLGTLFSATNLRFTCSESGRCWPLLFSGCLGFNQPRVVKLWPTLFKRKSSQEYFFTSIFFAFFFAFTEFYIIIIYKYILDSSIFFYLALRVYLQSTDFKFIMKEIKKIWGFQFYVIKCNLYNFNI